MPRFFVSREQIDGDQAVITGGDVAHIGKVLRMSPGQELSISDGEGTDYYCRITEMDRESIHLEIIGSWPSFSELPAKIYLYQGLPKAGKMDMIIQKAVELGVYKIIPVQMARSVAKIEGEKKEQKKLVRWQGISESAAKQAGRAIIPEVTGCLTFAQAMQACAAHDAVLLPYEKAEGMEAARGLIRSLHGCREIGILIGPEGGFEESEVKLAVETAGAKTMSLGHRILRTETAGMTVISILMFELEEDRAREENHSEEEDQAGEKA